MSHSQALVLDGATVLSELLATASLSLKESEGNERHQESELEDKEGSERKVHIKEVKLN